MSAGGEHRQAEEHEAEQRPHHDQCAAGVLPRRWAEGGDTVGDGLDTRDGRASGTEGLQHDEYRRAQQEPVSVVGVGGLDYWKDGRDIFDNVSVIFEYPEGQKFVFTSICNNAHLDFSEVIMGDEGTIEITLGNNSAKAMLFRETKAKDAPTNKVKTAGLSLYDW